MGGGLSSSKYQGVKFNSTGDPVNYVRNPAGVDRASQGELIEAINALNGIQRTMVDDPEIETESPNTSWRSGCR